MRKERVDGCIWKRRIEEMGAGDDQLNCSSGWGEGPDSTKA